jgi:tetratricopeptide (TPR) repeat protein
MTEGGVDWVPALVALGFGLALGAAVAVRAVLGRRAAAAATADERDLIAKRDALVQQLREMEDTARKRPPGELARERYQLELQAARVVLALEDRTPASPPSSPVSRGSDRSALRGFLWGIGTATAAGLLGVFVYQAAKPREAGGSLTGEVPGRGAPGMTANAPSDPDQAQIEAALARNPDDTDARLARARILLGRQDYMGVWGETTRVLEKSPGNPQALSYQALVRLEMGQGEVALDLLHQALRADPDLIDAYVHLALVHVRLGRTREAEADIAQAAKRFPQQAGELRRALVEIRESQTDAPPAAAAPNPHVGLATPGGAQRPPATATPGKHVSGTVDLDPALRDPISPQAVLFVFVRQAGASAGPPIAVKRLPPKFPAAFELSEADAMLGQPFPDALLLEARLDSDGDPMTRSPTDPKARLDRVRAGRSDLHLVLRRP